MTNHSNGHGVNNISISRCGMHEQCVFDFVQKQNLMLSYSFFVGERRGITLYYLYKYRTLMDDKVKNGVYHNIYI